MNPAVSLLVGQYVSCVPIGQNTSHSPWQCSVDRTVRVWSQFPWYSQSLASQVPARILSLSSSSIVPQPAHIFRMIVQTSWLVLLTGVLGGHREKRFLDGQWWEQFHR